MIIFFNKKTGEVYGTISGRVHSEEELNRMIVKPQNVPDEDVGKWVAPYKPLFKMVDEPITELRIVDEKTRKVENVVIGKRRVKHGNGMKATGRFATRIEEFEKNPSKIYEHRIKSNEKGELEDFIINQ